MKLLVINGPNLNMLGIREPEIYGAQTYDALCSQISKHAVELGISVECYQSNYEGDLVTKIQDAYFAHVDGIVLNPAAYTHTSVALLDALKAVQIPTVEVHISQVDKREDFRQISYVRAACVTAIWGHGFNGYLEAMDLLVNLERSREKGQQREAEGAAAAGAAANATAEAGSAEAAGANPAAAATTTEAAPETTAAFPAAPTQNEAAPCA